MGARWLYMRLLRIWLIQGLVLGIVGHYYSVSRRRLVPSGLLRWYSWLLMLATLCSYWAYWLYSQDYFVEGMFLRLRFVKLLCDGNIWMQLLHLLVQTVARVCHERQVCAVYNELMAIQSSRGAFQGEPSRFYYAVFFAKLFNYLQNFNFGLGILIILDMRSVNVWDYVAHIYFVYMSLVRECLLMSYLLLLLQLAEALRVNGEHPRTSYGALMRQLRRQERLHQLVQRAHRLFACQVLAVMIFQLYFNTVAVYLGYSFFAAPPVSGSTFRVWNVKFLLTAAGVFTKLFDGLLLQIVGEHLLAQGNKSCASPQLKQAGTPHTQAVERQLEMACLKRAIRAGYPDNRVLGLFSMDMRCAFAMISSSLSYGIIIMQLGYIHS